MHTKDKQHSIAWEIAPVSVLLMMIFTISLSAGGELVSLAPIIYLFLSMPMLYSMAHVMLNKPKLDESERSNLSENLRWLSTANKIISITAMSAGILVTCALISSAITFAYTAGANVGLDLLAGLVVGAAITDLIVNVSGLLSSYIKEQSKTSDKPFVCQSYGKLNEQLAKSNKPDTVQVRKNYKIVGPPKTGSSPTLPTHYQPSASIDGGVDSPVTSQIRESAKSNENISNPYNHDHGAYANHSNGSTTNHYQRLTLKPN